MFRNRSSTLLLALLWPVCGTASQVAEPAIPETPPEETASLFLACSPERPAVEPGGRLRLRAWAAAEAPGELTYRWSTTLGDLEGSGAEVSWTLPVAEPGYYEATVVATDRLGREASCGIAVRLREGSKGSGTTRVAGRSMMVCDGSARSARGYGLYSYLLVGVEPTGDSRDRLVAAIEVYLELIPDVADFQRGFPRKGLNITFLPVRSELPQSVQAGEVDWLLENYDYDCARELLLAVPIDAGDGPVIVSVHKPLGTAGALGEGLFFWDLSRVPPHLISAGVREFLIQSAQLGPSPLDGSGSRGVGVRLAHGLQTAITILGHGVENVLDGFRGWISGVG